MSHQLQGERAGLIDVDFDLETMDRIASDPEWFTQFSNADIMRRTGTEGIETIMWLVTRPAGQRQDRPQALPRAHLQHRRRAASRTRSSGPRQPTPPADPASCRQRGDQNLAVIAYSCRPSPS
jgi:hypothetical protein